MKKTELLTVKQTLEILRKKQPVSEPTLKAWIKTGLIHCEEEKHGMFKWRFFRKSEVSRILALLPKERVNGLPLLPRKK